MPEISRFLGVVIAMFYNDHNPPHFHAYYGEHEAAITIGDGEVLWGSLPRRALGHVQEWRGSPCPRVGGRLAAGQDASASHADRTAGVDMPRLVEARYIR